MLKVVNNKLTLSGLLNDGVRTNACANRCGVCPSVCARACVKYLYRFPMKSRMTFTGKANIDSHFTQSCLLVYSVFDNAVVL